MNRLVQDVKYALRLARKNPAFTSVVLLTLVLGIGATTAVFSLVNAVLLRPLPYDHPDGLVQVWDHNSKMGANELVISYPKFSEWADQTQVFQSISAYTTRSFDLEGSDVPEQIPGARVSADFFKVLGVRPLAGRTFLAEEDRPGGGESVILSYDLWQRLYGGRPVLGSTVALSGKVTTIVGVMPQGFHFPDDDVMLWVPRVFDIDSLPAARVQQGAGFLSVIGRISQASEMKLAEAELATIDDRYRQHYTSNIDRERNQGRGPSRADSQRYPSDSANLAGRGWARVTDCRGKRRQSDSRAIFGACKRDVDSGGSGRHAPQVDRTTGC
jgi:hypothetical protein